MTKQKVLIIEDDRIMRENTAELLELSGYSVAVAENGKEGIQQVEAFQPDLIICDIMMPELDGYGVLYVLSKSPETASIPFIFLTAKTEKADLRKGMNLGADDYLTKPFEDMELLNAVESRFKKHALLKQEFEQNATGLTEFIDQAEGLQAIRSLTFDRKLYHYKPKEFLFREGDMANFLYFIEKGQVKTFKQNDDAKEYIVELFNSGDFLGYQPLLEDRRYTEYASALEETEVYKIPKADFLHLVFHHRDVSARFIKMMSHNLSEKEDQLLQLAYDSVKKRVAHQLLHHFDESKQNSLNISRSDLAALTGTTKETLVRCLTDMKEDKIIATDGQTIELLNREQLEQLLRWS
jgi:CheY-like chemotaxis protein